MKQSIEIGIINFVIVLLFNIFWAKDGFYHYLNMYNGNYNKWFSVGVWAYAVWGIINLIYVFI